MIQSGTREFAPAPMGRRALAALVDVLVVSGVTFYSVFQWGEILPDGRLGFSGIVVVPIVILISFYWIFPEWIFGATLGKWFFGLRVRSLKGEELSFWQAIKRHLASPVDVAGFGLIAYAVAKGNRRSQRIGDKWARTQVVAVGEDRPIISTSVGESPVLAPGVRLAPLWRRGVAAFLDFAIAFFVLGAATAQFGRDLGGGNVGWKGGEALLAMILLASYWVLPEWIWGVTLAKLAVGIKVVKLDGTGIDFGQSVKRHILRIVEFAGFFYLSAYAVAKDNRNRQRPGDMWANTIVILDLDPTQQPVSSVGMGEDR